MLFAIAPAGSAEQIPLLNPSFEALTGTDPIHFDTQGRLRPGHYSSFPKPLTPAGFLSVDAIPGWVGDGTAGTMAPLVGAVIGSLFGTVPHGQNTAYFLDESVLQQFLIRTYQANTRYVLTAEIGRPSSVAPPAVWHGFVLSLGAGYEWIAVNSGPLDIPAGSFRTVEISYSVAPGDPWIGHPITATLAGGGPSPTHFDHVRLEAQPLTGPPTSIATAVEVKWPSRLNEWYQVQRATRLNNPDWLPITGTLRGTGEPMSLFEVAAEQARYYRIMPMRPPQ
jgi:hypothetical protein